MSQKFQPISATMDLSAVREVRRLHSQVLTGWAAVSIAVGVVVWSGQNDAPNTKFFMAMGMQFVIWGAINLVFGLLGLQQSRSVDSIPVYANQATNEASDAVKLMRTLRVTMKMNWLWVACGLALIAWGVSTSMNTTLLGHGSGVLAQALFLFVFDKHFYAKLQRSMGQA